MVEQVKLPVTGTEASLQPVPLLWSLPAAVHRTLKAKWVSGMPLALQCQDFTTPETTCLSLGSLRTKSTEVSFREKSKLAYKLIRICLAVEVPHL